MTRGDVLVVGGGIVGLASAWRAAQSGLAVAVVDPAPGEAATHAAAGMIAPVAEAYWGEEDLLRLNLASADRWPAFAAELAASTGRDLGYRDTGTLIVAADPDDNAWLSDLHRFQSQLGLESTRLRSSECREAEPLLNPGIRGGILIEGEAHVDPRRVVGALLEALGSAGVEVVRERVSSVVVSGDSVQGVMTDSGELEAERVVLAAGCWSGAMAGLPAGVMPPVRPVKGQILRMRAPGDEPFLRRALRGVVHGSSVYVVPRADGEIVIGATQEEKGFDTSVTGGGAYELLRDAATLVPGVLELELVETSAGLRPGSPDNAPIIGDSGLEGLVVATGHHRSGVLLAPITAEVIAELLVSGTAPDVAAPFAPGRFQPVGVRS